MVWKSGAPAVALCRGVARLCKCKCTKTSSACTAVAWLPRGNWGISLSKLGAGECIPLCGRRMYKFHMLRVSCMRLCGAAVSIHVLLRAGAPALGLWRSSAVCLTRRGPPHQLTFASRGAGDGAGAAGPQERLQPRLQVRVAPARRCGGVPGGADSVRHRPKDKGAEKGAQTCPTFYDLCTLAYMLSNT